jgi:hypothetical protein
MGVLSSVSKRGGGATRGDGLADDDGFIDDGENAGSESSSRSATPDWDVIGVLEVEGGVASPDTEF